MKVGEKYGCLMILDEGEEYAQLIDAQIDNICKEKAEFEKLIKNGKLKRRDRCSTDFVYTPAYSYDPKSFSTVYASIQVADFDKAIEDKRKKQTIKKYKCKCRKCGKIRYYTEETIRTEPNFCYYPLYFSDKHTCSTRASNAAYRKRLKFENNETICPVSDMIDYVPSEEYCDKWNEKRRKEQAKKAEEEAAKIKALPRRLAANYDVDFTGTIYESLEVLECVNERLESDPVFHYNQRHQKIYSDITVYKQYRCRCYLPRCGKEQLVTCDRFGIHPPTAYGSTAYDGYWSGVKCNCHHVSSFQWIVNKLLIENKVPYRVEVSFSDLLGTSEEEPLRFDFAVNYEDGTVKCLIECQGEQHYKPVDEFGGELEFEKQVKHDTLKREYAEAHGIPLIEISYKDKEYDKIKEILQKNGILW